MVLLTVAAYSSPSFASDTLLLNVYYINSHLYPPLLLTPLPIFKVYKSGKILRIKDKSGHRQYFIGSLSDKRIIDEINSLLLGQLNTTYEIRKRQFPPILVFEFPNKSVKIKGYDYLREKNIPNPKDEDLKSLISLLIKLQKLKLKNEKPYTPSELWVYYEITGYYANAIELPQEIDLENIPLFDLPAKTWRKTLFSGSEAGEVYKKLIKKTFFGRNTIATFKRDSTYLRIVVVPRFPPL